MAFTKGQSGNPGGRPRKTAEQIKFEARCREWASLCAFDRLQRLTDSKNDTAALAALREILDRGFGKSTEFLEANVTQEPGISVEELGKELSDLLGGEAGKDSGADSSPAVEPGE